MAPSTVTSPRCALARPPAARISAASISSFSSRRATSATQKFRAANSRARAAPIPEDAPVMRAVGSGEEADMRAGFQSGRRAATARRVLIELERKLVLTSSTSIGPLRVGRREHIDRQAHGATLARIECADADDLARDLLAAVIANGDDNRVFPGFATFGIAEGPFHPQRGERRLLPGIRARP